MRRRFKIFLVITVAIEVVVQWGVMELLRQVSNHGGYSLTLRQNVYEFHPDLFTIHVWRLIQRPGLLDVRLPLISIPWALPLFAAYVVVPLLILRRLDQDRRRG